MQNICLKIDPYLDREDYLSSFTSAKLVEFPILWKMIGISMVDISEEEIPLEFWRASGPVFLCTLKVKDQNLRVKKETKKSAPENELHQFITQSKIQTFPSSNGEENYV